LNKLPHFTKGGENSLRNLFSKWRGKYFI